MRSRTARGASGIVLDAFGGSGTTLIAAHRTGRVARLLEIDPLYVDVILRRWEALTGESARLAETGRTFAERAQSVGMPEVRGGGGAMSDEPYKVGAAKPRLAFPLPTGQSGNPSGRPKGARNLRTIVPPGVLARGHRQGRRPAGKQPALAVPDPGDDRQGHAERHQEPGWSCSNMAFGWIASEPPANDDAPQPEDEAILRYLAGAARDAERRRWLTSGPFLLAAAPSGPAQLHRQVLATLEPAGPTGRTGISGTSPTS